MAMRLYAFSTLRRRGVRFIWTYFTQSLWFDIKHHTNTSFRVPKDQQLLPLASNDSVNGLLYVASFTSVIQTTIRLALNILGSERLSSTQFLDLGCGKGKAVLLCALEYQKLISTPILGIEYDPSLVDIALSNVSQVFPDNPPISIVNDSAVNLAMYLSSPTLVVYLYNSFQGKTLQQVLQVLADIPHILIYVDPAERHILPDFGYHIEHEHVGRYNANTWLIARSPLL